MDGLLMFVSCALWLGNMLGDMSRSGPVTTIGSGMTPGQRGMAAFWLTTGPAMPRVMQATARLRTEIMAAIVTKK
jgi:hypothetical protein